ncbi:MAG: hypothetical protein J6B77_09095 [Clostridia bacterium]|nr:hypothetical protein [Clostridia bacterium]
MTETKRKARTRAQILHDRRYREVAREFANGRMSLLLRRYLAYCGVKEGIYGADALESDRALSMEIGKSAASAKKGEKSMLRLPNPAGFCRFLELDRESFLRLEAEFPTEVGRMRAVFEDEALNSGMSATVLGFYLRDLLGAIPKDADVPQEGGDITVKFAHDILTDGK